MHKILKRRTGLAQLHLEELWQYRELFGFLAWRDVLVRYKQTVIGVLWAFIRPFTMMVIFTFVFGHLAKMPSEGLPYPVITFAALLPWQLFSSAFSEASTSVVGNFGMISKIYFPRLIIPISATVLSVFDFLVSFVILAGMMIWYHVIPSLSLLWLPAFTLLCILFSVGSSLWFSSLYVKYRDIRQVIPFITQIGLYLSPVGFSTTALPAKYRTIYFFNPMVGIIDGFRWSLLGGKTTLFPMSIIISVAVTAVVLVSGLFFYKTTERMFADLI